MGDNGTGTPVTSMLNGNPVQGGKGKTTDAGTHVPFIANWPDTIPTSQVSDDLLDSTDVLPTLCQAAGVPVPQGLDGRSFLPQLLGQTGTPRQWSYCWYKPQNGTEADVKEFAHTVRFKLYPPASSMTCPTTSWSRARWTPAPWMRRRKSAFDLLTGALASFSDARLDRTLPPQPNPAAVEFAAGCQRDWGPSR